jgi:hypothetical protein
MEVIHYSETSVKYKIHGAISQKMVFFKDTSGQRIFENIPLQNVSVPILGPNDVNVTSTSEVRTVTILVLSAVTTNKDMTFVSSFIKGISEVGKTFLRDKHTHTDT